MQILIVPFHYEKLPCSRTNSMFTLLLAALVCCPWFVNKIGSSIFPLYKMNGWRSLYPSGLYIAIKIRFNDWYFLFINIRIYLLVVHLSETDTPIQTEACIHFLCSAIHSGPKIFFKPYKYPLTGYVVYLHDRLLHSNNKEQTTDTQNNMHEFRNTFCENKRVQRVHIVHFTYLLKYTCKASLHWWTLNIPWLRRLWGV